MRKSYQEICSLLDNFPNAVLMKTTETIKANKAAKVLFREARCTLNEFQECIEGLVCGINTVRIKGKIFSVEYRMTALSGETVKLFFINSSDNSGDNEDDFYKACLDAITDLHIIACDRTGKIRYYNDLSAKIDNINRQDAIGCNIFELFETKTETSIRGVLRTGEPVLDWSSCYTSNGAEIPCLGSSYPIKTNGKLAGAISINRSNSGIRNLLTRTIELQKTINKNSNTKSNGTSYTFDSIIGTSEKILKCIEYAKMAANSVAPILIYGETGTGKELFAQSIHNASVRKDKPFVAINCAAIPETLMESTLFGTCKGAFTGSENSGGLFEQAGEGTLFLDEINSLPIGLQSKLLRVLQERSFRKVGGNKEITVNCRIISACNRSPLECVEDNTMRSDLYYRLAVVCIEVPPLRERKEDIPVIAEYFINTYAKIYGVHHIKLSKELQHAFCEFHWPGNIRELRHVIESSMFRITSGNELKLEHMPEVFTRVMLKNQKPHATAIDETFENDGPYDLEEKIRNIRKAAILKALNECDGNISRAAKMIGYSRSTLQYQMGKLSISYPAQGREE